jgi:hypothetical protein
MGFAKCGDAKQLTKCVAHEQGIVAQASYLWGRRASRLQNFDWAGRMPTGAKAETAVLNRFQRALQIVD